MPVQHGRKRPRPRPSQDKPAKARKLGPFKWDDALLLDDVLTEDERAIRDAAHDYCQEKLFPRVLEANRHERVSTARS